MPLTAAQIVTLATQEAKCPGYTSQAGQLLNATLQDLCQNYDLDAALGTFTFTFNSVTGNGSGPYQLPADYLRTQVKDGKDEFFYTIQGVPYPLIQVTKAEYDWLVQTPGFNSYPYNYATDLSQVPAQLFVWPPASGSYPCTLRYYRLMADIVTPETSATVPWFLNTQILIRSLAGRLMGITGDSRQAEYLGTDPDRYPLGAGTLLSAYLKNVEDREGAVHTVGKDRRRWGRPFDQLKNTKNIGWLFAAFVLSWFALMQPEPARATCTAPCTSTQIIADTNTNFPDNTIGLITPAIVRAWQNNLVNSIMPAPPVVSGNLACFNGTTGLLQDCAVPSASVLTQQIFTTLAAATASNISSGVTTVKTLGRSSAGDNGGASYNRIGPSTAAAWRFQSADGQWWALNNRVVTPEMFGIFTGTDDTAAFVQLANWLNTASSGGITNGGIIVNFLPGADYQIWPAGTTPGSAISLISTNGITFNFNGARISTLNDWTHGNAAVFNLRNVSNMIFNDPSYACVSAQCSGTVNSNNFGLFFYVTDIAPPWSNNIKINNVTQSWGSAFLTVAGDIASGGVTNPTGGGAYNIQIINANLSNVFYGMAFQAAGDNVVARGIKGTNMGRIYFPWNVSNHDVELIGDGDLAGFVNVHLKSYGLPWANDTRRALSNIHVKYRDQGGSTATGTTAGLFMQQFVPQVNVSGAANNGSGLVRLTVDTTANMLTGQKWLVNSVGGNPGSINLVQFLVTVIDATHVDLQGSTFSGSYTSGGYLRVPAVIKDVRVELSIEGNSAVTQAPVFVTQKNNSDATTDTTVDGYTIENVEVSGSIKNANSGSPAISLFANNGTSTGTWANETLRNIGLRNLTISGPNATAIVDATAFTSSMVLANIWSTPGGILWTVTDPNTKVRTQNVSATGVSDGLTVPSLPLPAVNGGTGGTSGAVVAVKIQLFTSTGTYTPSTGLLYAQVEACGGGGGGGGTANTAANVGAGGAGGGAGSYSFKLLSAAAVGASKSVTIGTAGTAGASGNNAGGNGGDSCLGGAACTTNLVVGKGGTGGGGSAGSGAPLPGAGGVAGTGDLTTTGNPGHGFPALANTQGYGGNGGAGFFQGGSVATMTATSATGSTGGSCSGGGGGASFNAGGAAAGGPGGGGLVKITEYTNQ